MPERDQVFISYSHRDRRFLKELQTHLAPFVRNRTVDYWADTRLRGGDDWRHEIAEALARAKVAVLLSSQTSSACRSRCGLESRLSADQGQARRG